MAADAALLLALFTYFLIALAIGTRTILAAEGDESQSTLGVWLFAISWPFLALLYLWLGALVWALDNYEKWRRRVS